MGRVWSAGICIALSLLAAPASRAQKPRVSTLVATVAVDGSRELLPDAEVAITDLSRTAKSDIVGEAAIANVPPGPHTVRVRAMGYDVAEALLEFRRDTVAVTFYLKPVATQLAALEVSATRVPHGLEEFEVRRAMGIGKFLTQNRIDSASTTDFNTFMAASFPGLKVIFLANGEHVLGSTRSSCDADLSRIGLPGQSGGHTVGGCSPTKPCPVPVILDGQDLHDAVGDVIHLRELAAAEFYTGTQVPTQYRVSGYGCGVLILWSRRP